jgi:hypothetical protein
MGPGPGRGLASWGSECLVLSERVEEPELDLADPRTAAQAERDGGTAAVGEPQAGYPSSTQLSPVFVSRIA